MRGLLTILFHACCVFLLSLLMLFVQLGDRFIMRIGINLVRLERFHNVDLIFHNPWQYRVLSNWLLDAWLWLLQLLHIEFSNTPLAYTPEGENFLTVASNEWPLLIFRLMQNILLLALAFKLYTFFTPRRLLIYLSLIVLAYCLGLGNFNSDLSFNTYFDVIFYLLACIWILQKKYHYFPFLVIAAALNRETSGLIPALLLVEGIHFGERKIINKRAVAFAGLSFLLYIAILFCLRLYYGYAPLKHIYGFNHITDYLAYNFMLPASYMKLLMIFSILPLLALVAWRYWPPVLRKWFWVIVPLWFIIHFSGAVVAESRLFYVPVAIVFVPALLAAIESSFKKDSSFNVLTVEFER